MNADNRSKTPVLLSYAFRPFFLLNGLFAVLAVLAWTLTLHGAGLVSLTPYWHAHEMLVGFAMAMVAGFSLTAVATWTGRPAVHGLPLAVLVLFWLAGRLVMALSHLLPGAAVAFVDLLFPLLLTILFAREVIAGKSHRNYLLIAIIFAMALLNAVYHMAANGITPGIERQSLNLLIHAMLLLVTLVAGRIVPAFTANWLRKQGRENLPKVHPGMDRISLVVTLLTGLAASLAPLNQLTGWLAFAAMAVHGYRLSRWQGLATLSNPLLFVLHAAYVWMPVGYALLACSVFGWGFSQSAALHALTMGAIGSMALAVTTRVALGHTGRPLHAPRAVVLAYWIVMFAVITRVLAQFSGPWYLQVIELAAAGWILAFAIFCKSYWPILTRRRPDQE